MRGLLSGLLASLAAFMIATAGAQEAQPPLQVSTSTTSSAPVPSIEDFLAEPTTDDVALNPGGTHVASVILRDGVAYLVVTDLKTPGAKPAARRLGEVYVYGLKWISDDRLIFSAGSKDVGVDYKRGRLIFTGVPRLFAVNRDLTNDIVFFQGDKKVASLNVISTSDINLIRGDTENFLVPLLVGRNLDLARVNARDGKWSSIARGAENTIGWYVDRSGQPAMRVDTNRRRTELRFLTPEARGNGEIKWKEASKFRLNRDKDRALDFWPVAPGPTDDLYYVIGKTPGADRTAIYLYNTATQQFDREVFSHPRVDIESALVDRDTGEYIGASYWEDRLGTTFVDRTQQTHFDALHTFFGQERNISIIQTSSDQKTWIIATSGPRDPGSYHVYDMRATRSELIGSRNPHLREQQLGKSQVVSYKARDGLGITGYLTLPPNLRDGAKPPLIVYPHGGPESRDAQSYDLIVQFLATRGYAVFQPNFRGSSGYGQSFVEAGRRQFGKAMQTDLVDGVNHLASLGLVDTSRMCIMGASYGGYAALIGVVQFPDMYRCAIASSGPSDLYRQVRWEREEEGGDSEAYKYWVGQIGDPWKDRAEMEAISPINHIDRIVAPVLLLHGKQDDTVPFEQSEKMHAAMQKAGKNVRIVQFEDAGHGFTGDDLKVFLGEVEKFLREHLPTTVD
ncbi:MAG TPA: S9 family peptidase [Hyphomonadaceae bacterium]|nr:S9 family peptidase [Hyphomonadaceae bacterium]